MTPENTAVRTNKQRNILTAFQRALRREQHVLTEHPDLLWQQLFNRLQWEGPQLTSLLHEAQRSRQPKTSRPWLHILTPQKESKRLLRTLAGRRGPMEDCAFSPDGTRLVAVSHSSITIWDTRTGQVLLDLEDAGTNLNACAFSRNGDLIFVYPILPIEPLAWNGTTGVQIPVKKGTRSYQEALARLRSHLGKVKQRRSYSPDGARYAEETQRTDLTMYETASGNVIRRFSEHLDQVNYHAFSPDGNRLVSGSKDMTLKVWDVESGEPERTLHGHAGAIIACRFSPDGVLLASAGKDGTVRLWDIAPDRMQEGPSPVRKGHLRRIQACSFSSDGSQILSGGADRAIKIWDAMTGETLRSFEGQMAAVNDCSFSPDARRIVAAYRERMLKILDAASGETLQELEGHVGFMANTCAFSPNGDVLVSGGDDKTVRIWDAQTGCELHKLEGHDHSVSICAFSPDGQRVLSGSADQTLKIWDVQSGREILTYEGHHGEIEACAFGPGGELVISGGKRAGIFLWNANTGQTKLAFPEIAQITKSCSFSPDGQLIFIADKSKTDGFLRIWNANTYELIAELPITGALLAVAHHPHEPKFAYGGQDGLIHIARVAELNGSGEE